MRTNLFIIGGLVAVLIITMLFTHVAAPTVLEEHIQTLHQQIATGSWTEAAAGFEQLEREWAGRRPWLQLTKSVQTIFDIDRLLARLQVNIEIEERAAAAENLAEIERLWRDLRE